MCAVYELKRDTDDEYDGWKKRRAGKITAAPINKRRRS